MQLAMAKLGNGAKSLVSLLDAKEALTVPVVVFLGGLAAANPSTVEHPDSRRALIGSAALIAVWCGAAAGCPSWFGTSSRLARLGRDLLVLALCMVVYPSTRWAVPLIHDSHYDGALAAADRWMFGGRDPLPLLDPLVHPLSTAALGLAYSCAWVPGVALGFLLYARGRDRELSDLLLGLVLVQYAGYIGYFLVPAVGPWYGLADRFSVSLGDSWWIASYRSHSTGSDAFPSLHIATTVLVGCFAWRDCRRLWLLMCPLIGAIGLSTMYLRWHYVTDVIAGLVLAAAGRLLAPRLNDAWAQVRSGWSSPSHRPVAAGASTHTDSCCTQESANQEKPCAS
ncbi:MULTISPECIES: phosphatase PAP2 family protein [unclassified Streptomyces]|uniref:phosphatase PAP2 family protein n=1 Tax=unclassified Streptomyces TaxID=2593676 RepID=UPI002366903B|nr:MULTISPECIES: phosphatase PAP2 family protein [unclassified Streptomyces]MDF3142279.1 phosphatase PAP2 family protein [Streptomyces sp. T21Q-yed]WDF37858.1 phosphatase PAP2 family protein [Streptomyces sp. T12]